MAHDSMIKIQLCHLLYGVVIFFAIGFGRSLARFDRLEPRHYGSQLFHKFKPAIYGSRYARNRSGVILSVRARSSCSPLKGNVQMIDYKRNF